MTTFYLNLKKTLEERREAGQGTIEYLGIAVVIGIVIAAVVAFMTGGGTQAITDGISNIIDGIVGDSAY